jgi:hypothetical protein
MGGVVLVSCMVISEMHTKFLLGNVLERYHAEDLSRHGRTARSHVGHQENKNIAP